MKQQPFSLRVDLAYGEHFPWLKAWLQRRLGNPSDAADLAQDTFLRLLARPREVSFTGEKDARAYLRAIAHGMCVDLWRRRDVERAWLETLAVQGEPLASSPEDHAIVIETLMEVGALLARLPSKATQAFLMAQIHGLHTEQIASELGVSMRMVQKYIAQVMLELAMADAGLKAPARN